MRDKLKSQQYFKNYISELEEMIILNQNSLSLGSIPENRVSWVKMNTFNYQLNKAVALYSLGESFDRIANHLSITIKDHFAGAWSENITKVSHPSTGMLNQYTVDSYIKMLRMLSLSYLLEIPQEIFLILVNKIKSDSIFDKLFDYIINKYIGVQNGEGNETYDPEASVILKVYNKLRIAIFEIDKSHASILVESYLKNDFYHKNSGFFDSHKSKANVYFGYWSFEAAAIVAINNLDDTSFRDNEYYPKDLVDYYRSRMRVVTD